MFEMTMHDILKEMLFLSGLMIMSWGIAGACICYDLFTQRLRRPLGKGAMPWWK